jgi:hypothetical protein
VFLPTVTLAVSPNSVTEDGPTNLGYIFTRAGSTINALTVNYGIAGTANATDYTGATPGTGKTITFAAGSATATLTLDPTADTTIENNETVALTLATGTGYTIGTTTAVTGTITNDDTAYTDIEFVGNTKFVKDATNKYFAQVGTATPIAIKNGGQQIYKDISDEQSLINAFDSAQKLSTNGIVFVENDLRAFCNPTRQEIIKNAAKDLVQQLRSTCPACSTPGYWRTKRIPGLRCSFCNQKTRLPVAEVWNCQACAYENQQEIKSEQFADPSKCDFCNP